MIASLTGTLLFQDGDQIVVDVRGVGYLVHASATVLTQIALVATPVALVATPSTSELRLEPFEQQQRSHDSAKSTGSGNSLHQLRLIVHTDVRENDISLWGFSSLQEKQMFLLLKKVSGVGSKTAMGIVSRVGADALLQRIGAGDISGLTAVPGVGKKTAERIVVELREQVSMLAQVLSQARAESVQNSKLSKSKLTKPLAESITAELNSDSSPVVDAELALEKLGFSLDRARRAVQLAAEGYIAAGTLTSVSAGELVQQALSKL